MMKKIALWLVAAMLLLSLSACGSSGSTNSSGTTDAGSTAAETKSNDADSYTWDVTVYYYRYYIKDGEMPPVVTMTEKADPSHTATFDPEALVNSLEDPEDLTSITGDDGDYIVAPAEVQTVSATFNEDDWTFTDEDRQSSFTFEVITPLTEGDYASHGELLVTCKAHDYTWHVTVDFGDGTQGTYEMTNPGLSGWGEPYENQKNVVDPDNSEFDMVAFNHSDWIVDNTKDWYKWVIFDVDDNAPEYEFEIVKPLTVGDRFTPGELTIHIYIP